MNRRLILLNDKNRRNDLRKSLENKGYFEMGFLQHYPPNLIEIDPLNVLWLLDAVDELEERINKKDQIKDQIKE